MTSYKTLDHAAMQSALKEYYDSQKLMELTYKDAPLFGLLPKKEAGFGNGYPIPMQSARTSGSSANFTQALANKQALLTERFLLTPAYYYTLANLSNFLMEDSANNKASFINAATHIVNDAVKRCSFGIQSQLFRNGTGSIGVVGSISSGVITLADDSQVVQFERNMALNICATDGSAVATAAIGYVVAVDRALGKVSVSATMGGAVADPDGTWTGSAGYYIVENGNLNSTIKGVSAWVPASAPSSASFFGLDRTGDITRLGGNRYDGTGLPIEEALINAISLTNREGGNPDYAFVNHKTFSALQRSIGAKAIIVNPFDDAGGKPVISYKGILFESSEGPITVMADRNVQANTAHLMEMDSWELVSTGKAPHIVTFGANGDFFRDATADGAELRVASYAQLGCNAPGHNCHVTLSL